LLLIPGQEYHRTKIAWQTLIMYDVLKNAIEDIVNKQNQNEAMT